LPLLFFCTLWQQQQQQQQRQLIKKQQQAGQLRMHGCAPLPWWPPPLQCTGPHSALPGVRLVCTAMKR
jgi:hypothetical protein